LAVRETTAGEEISTIMGCFKTDHRRRLADVSTTNLGESS
jgi:hypothetical protein